MRQSPGPWPGRPVHPSLEPKETTTFRFVLTYSIIFSVLITIVLCSIIQYFQLFYKLIQSRTSFNLTRLWQTWQQMSDMAIN